jgi:hypothetical protein
VTDATDTAPAARGGFPEVRPVEDAPPELGRFVAAMRRLQDLTVSTNPNSSLWADAAAHLESACALLDGHQVPETQVVAGRVLSIPGLGHPLMPPWTVTAAKIRPTRTAFLHVDYRNITPINEPLEARGTITEIDGRKVFITATMTAADGAVLSEANGLMARLLPHQP